MTLPSALGIAVVGSGYTSASILTHLLDLQPELAAQITVFGPGPFGHGAAFGTAHPDFRLNVRAQIMQLRPARPDVFPAWAEQNIEDKTAHCAEGAFYRRADFARYLNTEIEKLSHSDEVSFCAQRVISADFDNGSALWHLVREDGQFHTAETLILATGNPTPDWPCPIDEACWPEAHSLLIRSPWSGTWLDKIDPGDEIVVVGGGLTAMDAVYALGRAGHSGRIRIVTPVGLLPPAQTDWIPYEAVTWPDDIDSASEFIRFFNRRLKANKRYDWTDTVWQSRFEALRVHLNPVWRRLADSEKRRLMAHLGAFWSLARYRSAPQTNAMATQLQNSGQLELLTGRVVHISAAADPGRLSAHLASGETLPADGIVNCTGMGRDPLLADMLTTGVVRADAFGRGPGLGDDLRLCTPSGQPYPSAYALGALTAGSEGDVVGATTISRQAAALARHMHLSESQKQKRNQF